MKKLKNSLIFYKNKLFHLYSLKTSYFTCISLLVFPYLYFLTYIRPNTPIKLKIS